MRRKGLFESLCAYSQGGAYPFHMPGHKRNAERFSFPDPYSLDITEIEGFDNLHEAGGILKNAMERCASLFGADETHFLVNGGTAGLLAGVGALTRRGDRVLLARNCHKAVYNGVLLNGLNPVYLYPKEGESGMNGGISPRELERLLCLWTDIRLAVLTSPTYEGVVSDIGTIAQILHKKGIPLLVDEAHGAHFGFHPGFPRSALSFGADVVIQSVHKTLPAFTQSALLHIRGNLADRDRIRRNLSIYQSSSPSYLLMAGIERCMDYMEQDQGGLFGDWNEMLEEFYERTKDLEPIRVRPVRGGTPEERARGINLTNVYDIDKSKLILSLPLHGPVSGAQFSETLRLRYGLQMEMASHRYLLAMTGMGDRREGFLRLERALRETARRIARTGEAERTPLPEKPERPDMVMTPGRACEQEMCPVGIEECEGRIAGDYLYLYPPGIPLVVPGERIGRGTVRFLSGCLASGLTLGGISPEGKMTVLKKEF